MQLESPGRELLDLRGAYGRLFTLGAQALEHHSRDAVRVALMGHGENIHLRPIRLARIEVGHQLDKARHALALRGQIGPDATRLLFLAMANAREVIEEEWDVRLPVASGGVA